MHDRNITSAFDMLLEELDAIVTNLNQQGAQLMQAKDYDQAREVIDKAETLLAFRGKVEPLQDEWSKIELPHTNKIPDKKPVKRNVTKVLKKGLRTPNEDFRLPILQALFQLGGSGRVSVVLDFVEEIMTDQLNKYDYQTIPSDPKVIRWRNNAQWARLKLVEQGYLRSDSPRGVWEINEEGRKLLGSATKQVNEQEPLYFQEAMIPQNKDSEHPFKVGQYYQRQSDLHDKYGGNRQSGIAACAEYPFIFLFTSPSGDDYGYEDGWVSDDEFILTGEGQSGDMEMTRGNRAILNHVEDDRALHLFSKISAGTYEYLGRFVYVSHKFEPGLDKDGNTREIIQFRLKKV